MFLEETIWDLGADRSFSTERASYGRQDSIEVPKKRMRNRSMYETQSNHHRGHHFTSAGV